MQKDRVLTVGEVLLELKGEYLKTGEIDETGWALYLQGDGDLNTETLCCISGEIRVNDEYKEIYPEFALQHNMDSCLTGELVSNAVIMLIAYKPCADAKELAAALNYYIDNDDYYTPKGAVTDPFSPVPVVVKRAVEDKRLILKIRRTFSDSRPVGELVTLMKTPSALLTDKLTFEQAQQKIYKNDLAEWLAVQLPGMDNTPAADTAAESPGAGEMTDAFQSAFFSAVSELRRRHDEDFYYYAFIFSEGLRPYISAWSYEALKRSAEENGIGDDELEWYQWDAADSPYALFGYDEYFSGVDAMLSAREKSMDEDELYGREWSLRLECMEKALQRLDEQGFFGTGEQRRRVVINAEAAPPDGTEYRRAVRLNPDTERLRSYLDSCEE